MHGLRDAGDIVNSASLAPVSVYQPTEIDVGSNDVSSSAPDATNRIFKTSSPKFSLAAIILLAAFWLEFGAAPSAIYCRMSSISSSGNGVKPSGIRRSTAAVPDIF